MFKCNQILTSPFDFDNAMFFAKQISVWQDDYILEYGGFIESHTQNSVIINGDRYIKANCVFKVC